MLHIAKPVSPIGAFHAVDMVRLRNNHSRVHGNMKVNTTDQELLKAEVTVSGRNNSHDWRVLVSLTKIHHSQNILIARGSSSITVWRPRKTVSSMILEPSYFFVAFTPNAVVMAVSSHGFHIAVKQVKHWATDGDTILCKKDMKGEEV